NGSFASGDGDFGANNNASRATPSTFHLTGSANATPPHSTSTAARTTRLMFPFTSTALPLEEQRLPGLAPPAARRPQDSDGRVAVSPAVAQEPSSTQRARTLRHHRMPHRRRWHRPSCLQR